VAPTVASTAPRPIDFTLAKSAALLFEC